MSKFQKGQSGNPGGRPKLTHQQKDVLEELRLLAQEVPDVLRGLLHDPKAPAAVRLKAVEIILDRTYGKAGAPKEEGLDVSAFNARMLSFADVLRRTAPERNVEDLMDS